LDIILRENDHSYTKKRRRNEAWEVRRIEMKHGMKDGSREGRKERKERK
jgi:hypothetical protein